jgi:hypothetical protein
LPYSCHNVAQFQLSPQVIDQFAKDQGRFAATLVQIATISKHWNDGV